MLFLTFTNFISEHNYMSGGFCPRPVLAVYTNEQNEMGQTRGVSAPTKFAAYHPPREHVNHKQAEMY